MPNKKGKILELAREKGPKGLAGKENQNATGLTLDEIRKQCQCLEEEGCLRILVFSPLLVMEKSALDEIENAFFSLIQREQERTSQSEGIKKENLFIISSLPPRVIEWVLQRMIRSGKLRDEHGILFAVRREPALTPEEVHLLSELETMFELGEFRRMTIAEIQHQIKVSTQTFDRLLEALLKRKRVIHSREGILFHSQWLDGIIDSLTNAGKNLFTVAEFKEATGLTRKFAIPLLELLDQTGVTRKQGSSRIIL